MSEDPFKGFEEILKYFNSFYKGKGKKTNGSENKNDFSNEGYYCGDIPGGFQGVDPQFFLITSEFIANVIAGNIPFNVQNVIGNWLELIGQVIETFNAQQQYMQSGPGRFYDIKNLNINNPFCSWNETSSEQSSYEDSSQYINRDETEFNKNGAYENQYKNRIEMAYLKEEITELKREIEKLSLKIDQINKKD